MGIHRGYIGAAKKYREGEEVGVGITSKVQCGGWGARPFLM